MRLRTAPAGLLLILVLTLTGCQSDAQPVLVDIPTPPHPPSGLDRQALEDFMLASHTARGGLHTLTLCGDFQALLDVQHWGIMLELDRTDPVERNRAGCSMFQCRSDSGTALLGRNFDNRAGDLVVAWAWPDSGYASLSFIPTLNWRLGPDQPVDLNDPHQKRYLLLGPASTIEGLNEKGVTVTLASLGPMTTRPDPDKPARFLIHLVREILDHAGDLDEAVAIAHRYNVFDNGRHVITHHIFVADPLNGSAVLEWNDGVMEVLRSGPEPQAVTNTPLYGQEEQRLRNTCPRYRKLSRALDGPMKGLSWQEAMDLLAGVAQSDRHMRLDGEQWIVNTEWSTVFDMTRGEAYVCLDRKYDVVYRFTVPTSGGS